jgi:hypothetical protein
MITLFLFSSTAVAADQIVKSENTTENSVVNLGGLSVEIDPLVYAGFLLPKGYGYSFGLEKEMTSKWSLYGKVAGLHANLASLNENRELDEDAEHSKRRLENFRILTGHLGGRYYWSGIQDSWYAGPSLMASRFSADYTYKQATIRDTVSAVGLGANGGYRWIWDSGLSMRVGTTLARVVEHNQKTQALVQTSDSKEAEDDARSASNSTFMSSFDFSMGIKF